MIYTGCLLAPDTVIDQSRLEEQALLGNGAVSLGRRLARFRGEGVGELWRLHLRGRDTEGQGAQRHDTCACTHAHAHTQAGTREHQHTHVHAHTRVGTY